MPAGAVYVGRPTKWGNPHRHPTRAESVEAYRVSHLSQHPEIIEDARAELAGRDLACWCPPDQPCHADVLLEIANA